MTVYLLHFEQKFSHAGHYLGYTDDLNQRLQRHQDGNGAALTKAVLNAGISMRLARIWDGDRALERQLKNQKNTPRLCPICNQSLSRDLLPETRILNATQGEKQ